MVGLAAELAHGLMLTIGSLIIYADPSLAGLDSFIPLCALLIYVVGNLGLLAYGVVVFVFMLNLTALASTDDATQRKRARTTTARNRSECSPVSSPTCFCMAVQISLRRRRVSSLVGEKVVQLH
jgi:hypothetical protein